MDERTEVATCIPSIRMGQPTGMALKPPQRKRHPHFGDILPGRPRPAADLPIPTERREIKRLYAEYDSVVEQLSYSEGMALIRGFGYSKSTWLMRRYKHRRPRLPEVALTLRWVRSGKPMIPHKRRLTAELICGKGSQ
jgi:hypothetical protein